MIAAKLRKAGRWLGLDIRRSNYLTVDSLTLTHCLRHHGVQAVIDIGANTGQFAKELLKAGFTGKVLSLEPLTEAHERLASNSRRWRNWIIGPAVAIGSSNQQAEFYISENRVSSSLLPVLETHVSAAPESTTIATAAVTVRRLDELLADMDFSDDDLFLKIDTQGTERDVLEGASNILSRVVGLKVEMSLTLLYDKQRLYSEVDAYIRNLGFTLWDIVPGFRDPGTARLLQFDGIYFR